MFPSHVTHEEVSGDPCTMVETPLTGSYSVTETQGDPKRVSDRYILVQMTGLKGKSHLWSMKEDPPMKEDQ